jgi:hypothetical protein
MSKQMTNDELGKTAGCVDFLFVVATRHSFIIRHSNFVIYSEPKLARDIDLFLPIFFLWRDWIC